MTSRGVLVLALAISLVTPGPSLAATSAVTEQVLASFAGRDGAGPLDGVTPGPGGVLFGTAVFGGGHRDGCVFELVPGSTGYTEKVVFSFSGADGAKPTGTVTLGPDGTLYGDTLAGGAHGAGAVFELRPAGTGYAERVLYSFTGGVDGNGPVGAPVLNAHGDVFGVTQFGGTGNQGAIFEVTPLGREKILDSFSADAGQPQAGLAMAGDGALFGTLYGESPVHADGSVFRLSLAAGHAFYTDLFNFDGADGANPDAALTVDAHTGVIYGSTQYGGGAGSYGTVFALTPAGSGYTEAVLQSFTRSYAGLEPEAPLLERADGDLIGTTSLGGAGCSGIGCGTVFELVTTGTSRTLRVLYRFTGPPDGAEPELSGLVPGPGGEIFGTTRSGGTATGCADGGPGGVLGCGTVYRLTLSSAPPGAPGSAAARTAPARSR